MANRKQFYLDQEVASTELNAAFAYLEQADRALMADQGFAGVMQNATVVQHTGTPNLTVDISGNAVVYDQLGERIAWAATQNLDVSQDSNNVTTAVATVGNEKWISVFAVFTRTLTDPRTDGNSPPQTVYFDQVESFQFLVMQGAEAALNTAPRPALQSTSILLADLHFTQGMTQVLNSGIDISRRQDIFVISGSPVSIRCGTVKAALTAMLNATNTASIQVYTSIANLRAATAPSASNAQAVVSVENGGAGIYYYDAGSTVADDGANYVKPTGVGGGAGRWIAIVNGPSVVTYANVAALKAAALDATLRLAMIPGLGTFYYDASSSRPDDSAGATGITIGTSTTQSITTVTTITPTVVGGGAGRWLLQRAGLSAVLFDYFEPNDGTTLGITNSNLVGGVALSHTTVTIPNMQVGDVVDLEIDVLWSAAATSTANMNWFIDGVTAGPSTTRVFDTASQAYPDRCRTRVTVGSAGSHTFVVKGFGGGSTYAVQILSVSCRVRRP